MTVFHTVVGSGPPLVVLHGGMGLDHSYFRPWMDRCSDFASVVYMDFSGNGRSGRLSAEEIGHERWIEDVEEVRRSLGLDRVTLLGHSYGGILAQEYVLAHPGAVERLILANTTPAFDYPDIVVSNAERRGTPGQVERLLQGLSAPSPSDEAFGAVFRDILPLYFHRWDEAVARELIADIEYSAEAFNRAQFVELPDFDSQDRLGEIGCPTLVISGASDWIMPPEQGGVRLAAGIEGSRQVVLEESGHFPFAEEPDRFVALLRDWLAEGPGSGSPADP
jgi:proline iminopeptidase